MQNQVSLRLLAARTAFSIALVLPGTGHAVEYDMFAPTRSALEVVDGDVHARLSQAGCEAGHQHACSPLLQRSEFVSRQSQRHGDKVTYSWDILVPESFTYHASGGYLRAVRLINKSGESVLNFILDGEIGYAVGRKTCFGPDGFGVWHSVQLQVAWDSTKRTSLKDETPGILRVICDGVEVLSRDGRPNIGPEEEVWFSFGLAGSLRLADGDNTETLYRNVMIEPW